MLAKPAIRGPGGQLYIAAPARISGARRRGDQIVSHGLLKGLHPLLTADLLHALRSAGHGDEIVVVDANFPTVSTAKHSVLGAPVTLAGANVVDTLDAICSLLPLDFFEAQAAFHMAPSPGASLPETAKEVHAAGKAIIRGHAGMEAFPLERYAFYERARSAFVVVQAMSERRPYGCWILKKGVVGPDGKDLKP